MIYKCVEKQFRKKKTKKTVLQIAFGVKFQNRFPGRGKLPVLVSLQKLNFNIFANHHFHFFIIPQL